MMEVEMSVGGVCGWENGETGLPRINAARVNNMQDGGKRASDQERLEIKARTSSCLWWWCQNRWTDAPWYWQE